MARYLVEFFKLVSGDNGREADVVQGTFEVEAEDETAAAESAALRFAAQHGTEDWLTHADRVQVRRLDVPQGVSHWRSPS